MRKIEISRFRIILTHRIVQFFSQRRCHFVSLIIYIVESGGKTTHVNKNIKAQGPQCPRNEFFLFVIVVFVFVMLFRNRITPFTSIKLLLLFEPNITLRKIMDANWFTNKRMQSNGWHLWLADTRQEDFFPWHESGDIDGIIEKLFIYISFKGYAASLKLSNLPISNNMRITCEFRRFT